jgi:hypothetical protein
MESFQPGLSFSPVKRAEIASRLHEQFEPGLSLVRANPIFILNPGLKSQPGVPADLDPPQNGPPVSRNRTISLLRFFEAFRR